MPRRLTGLLALAAFAGWTAAAPARAHAAPDPVFASLLSAGSTAIPLGISGGLLFFGRGKAEGIRFDVGLSTLAIGSAFGPSVGQIYGEGGVDAVVTFILRTLTTTVMTVGAGFALRGGEDSQGAGTALLVLGAIPTAFLGLWDIFGAASSAKAARYREGHASLGIEPNVASLLACPSPIPCAL